MPSPDIPVAIEDEVLLREPLANTEAFQVSRRERQLRSSLMMASRPFE
jgi:hypothetical protein